MNDDTRCNAIDEIMEKMFAQLGEYVDHVQVHISFEGGEGTQCIHHGMGNWFARKGMAQEFIERDQARNHHDIKACEFSEDE
jgi:hypothetical protein